ncbi:hypothetical protein [Pseudomonas oryzihabitans]|uniref:hypothetical protein n=1 Tax=Pseudomonas oryzihabitans TaxID=47885 RepID=UPI0011A26C90|nr:hypothetical protein [Pseudomonas psychrotolerans]
MVLRTYKCEECSNEFTTHRHGQRFCNSTCKSTFTKRENKSNRQKATIQRRKDKLPHSGFGNYLLREVRRAGTVQVLSGLTSVEEIESLQSLRSSCTLANGFDNGKIRKDYELSHIAPVSSKGSLGLLCAKNLVITTRTYNRQRGKSYSGGGAFILRSELLTKWQINEKHNDAQVYAKIEKFLGSVLDDYLALHAPNYTVRMQLINRLAKKEIESRNLTNKQEIERQTAAIKNILQYFTTSELEEKASKLDVTVFGMTKDGWSELVVALKEAKRFAENGLPVNPTLLMYAEYLDERRNAPYNVKTFFLRVHGSRGLGGTVLDQISIEDHVAEQLTRDLHKEKIEWVYDGRTLADCFTVPERTPHQVVISHRLEQYLVDKHGMPGCIYRPSTAEEVAFQATQLKRQEAEENVLAMEWYEEFGDVLPPVYLQEALIRLDLWYPF